MLGPQRIAGVGIYFASEPLRDGAFTADCLALAGTECRQKLTERFISVVEPVELLARSFHQAQRRARRPFVFGAERDVQRGQPVLLRHLNRRLNQRLKPDVLVSRSQQEPPPGCRGKRNRQLQFGVIIAARPLPSLRPGMVEDVFALTVPFGIERRAGNDVLS